MHKRGNGPGPARLVAGTKASPVVAVEVLVEQETVAPVWVLLKLPGAPMDRPLAIRGLQKDAGQPARELLGHLIQGQLPSGACGTFDSEIITIVTVILHQGPDDQNVHGHPDWSA